MDRYRALNLRTAAEAPAVRRLLILEYSSFPPATGICVILALSDIDDACATLAATATVC